MSADHAAERTIMVDSQVRPQDVTDLAIIDAMRRLAREEFIPAEKAHKAYADAEVEYAPGRWMLSPRDVAKLVQALRPRAGERALAISAPYAGALLSALGLHVDERDASDVATIGERFNVIVCEGAVASAPSAWVDALAEDGRLGVIERDGPVGRAMLYLRAGGAVGSRALFDSTPPVMAGFEAKRAFVF